jgi:rhamnogalacturonyl hydrolase YesR
MEKEETTIKSIISGVKDQIEAIQLYEADMEFKSWGYEEGVLLTGNEAKVLVGSHYSLLEALKECRNTMSEGTGYYALYEKIDALIKNCEEGNDKV